MFVVCLFVCWFVCLFVCAMPCQFATQQAVCWFSLVWSEPRLNVCCLSPLFQQNSCFQQFLPVQHHHCHQRCHHCHCHCHCYRHQKGWKAGSQVPIFSNSGSLQHFLLEGATSKKQLTPKRRHFVAAFASASSKLVQKLLQSF